MADYHIIAAKQETASSVRVEVAKGKESSVALIIEFGDLSLYTEAQTFLLYNLLPSKERKSRALSGKEDVASIEAYFKAVSTIKEQLVLQLAENNNIKSFIEAEYSTDIITKLARADEDTWKEPHLGVCAFFAPDLIRKTQLYFDNADQREWNYPRVKPDSAICLLIQGKLASALTHMECKAQKMQLLPLVVGESKRMLINNASGTPVKPEGAVREAILYSYIILNWIQTVIPSIADKAFIVSIAQVGPFHQIMWNTIKGVRKFETEIVFKGTLQDTMDTVLLQRFNATVEASKDKLATFIAELQKINKV